jgi:hypothetical protein
MKRDMELIRLLLIQEEVGAPPELEAYPVEEQLYNLQLMDDAGFVVARFDRGSRNEVVGATIERLTWAGHDFLDATRDSKIWKMARDHFFKPAVSLTFPILLEWLKHKIQLQEFGVQTGSCDSTPPHVV